MRLNSYLCKTVYTDNRNSVANSLPFPTRDVYEPNMFCCVASFSKSDQALFNSMKTILAIVSLLVPICYLSRREENNRMSDECGGAES